MEIVVSGVGALTATDMSFADMLTAGPTEPNGQFIRLDENLTIPWIPRKGLRKMDRLSRIVTAAVAMALDDAGLLNVDSDNTGLILDTGFGSAGAVSKVLDGIYQEDPVISPLLFPNVVANASAGQAAMAFGLRGPSSVLGGIGGLMYAFDLMQAGRARRLLVGGCDEITDIYALALDDIGLGEVVPMFADGAAFIVLELAEDAQARGVKPYAELVAVSMASDPDFRLRGRKAYGGGGLTGVVEEVTGTATNVDALFGAGWQGTSLHDQEVELSTTYSTKETRWPKDTTGEMFACSNSLNTVLASVMLKDSPEIESALVCGYDSTRGQSAAALFRSVQKGTNS
jgi:hypothetical protein